MKHKGHKELILRNEPNSYRILSHFEMVYRPGERDLAKSFLKALGLDVTESGKYLVGFVGTPASGNGYENSITASEVTPEHWEFEQALEKEMQRPDLAGLSASYLRELKSKPQNRPHFGMAYSSLDSWNASVEGFQEALDRHPELKGRAEIASKFVPGSPGAQTDFLHHAFIHTDIVGFACLPLGVVIELQHYARNPT